MKHGVYRLAWLVAVLGPGAWAQDVLHERDGAASGDRMGWAMAFAGDVAGDLAGEIVGGGALFVRIAEDADAVEAAGSHELDEGFEVPLKRETE